MTEVRTPMYKSTLNKNYTGLVEWVNGDKYWYKEGKLHRLDGPAYERSTGYKEFWIDGILYQETEFTEAALLYKCCKVI